MEKRYERNIPAISEEDQKLLSEKRVLVVGCGGIGGYVIEYLARVGVGEITAVDGDCFEQSNLNRQLLSSDALLGCSKAKAAAERIAQINPDIRFNAVEQFLDAANAEDLVNGQDLVMDALDNVPARLLLAEACAAKGVTLVHGAIQGWLVQAAVVRPGSDLLHKVYGPERYNTVHTSLSFSPPFCAALEVAEAVKLLCGRPSSLEDGLLMVDMLHSEWNLLPASAFQDPSSNAK